jgi:hypothetical protein
VDPKSESIPASQRSPNDVPQELCHVILRLFALVLDLFYQARMLGL